MFRTLNYNLFCIYIYIKPLIYIGSVSVSELPESIKSKFPFPFYTLFILPESSMVSVYIMAFNKYVIIVSFPNRTDQFFPESEKS